MERRHALSAALAIIVAIAAPGHAQLVPGGDPRVASCALESADYNRCEQERAIRLRIQALELAKEGKFQKEPEALRCDKSKPFAAECLTATAAFHKTKAMLLQHEMNENQRRVKEFGRPK